MIVAVVAWLEGEGWALDQSPHDGGPGIVVARRDGQRLTALVSAATTAEGVDAAVGALLRTIDPAEEGTAYALVVPEAVVRYAVRVHPEVRHRLGIEVHGVDGSGRVRGRR
ncbi:hypothetical protein [Euzebya sp.]|uniref:hypothetical protein n=1 Tax=Euzebya sp. TaxID=1971409 RepID=UPI003510F1CE